MPITSTNRTSGPYAGTGSNTGPFPFTFKVFVTTDVQVEKVNSFGVTTIMSSGFTTTLNADQDNNPGGSVLLSDVLPSGTDLLLRSNVPYTQPAEFTNQGALLPRAITDAFDRVAVLVQQIKALAVDSSTSAFSSATSAAGSAATAGGEADEAATSAANAAASASAALASETSASGYSSSASGFATAASGSASAAAASAAAAASSQSVATTSASAAASSAQTAVNAPGTSGTSATSNTIGTGSKTFTTQTGKAWAIGQFVIVTSQGATSNWMHGNITAYDSGTGAIAINFGTTNGTGTFTDWSIALSGPSAGGNSLPLAGGTLSGKLNLLAAATGTAGVNLGVGVDPTSPVNGDFWALSGVLKARLNSVTYQVATLAGAEAFSNKTIDTAASNVLKINGNVLAATAGTATITFPNSSDTLVGRATVDTMTNKTFTAPTINGGAIDGATTVGDTSVAANSVGFRGIPQVTKTAAYTLALSDAAKQISITTGGITIPANGSVAFPIGTTIVVYNDSATAQNIAITTDTLRQAGTANTGTRSLAGYGQATLNKVKATEWVVGGNVT